MPAHSLVGRASGGGARRHLRARRVRADPPGLARSHRPLLPQKMSRVALVCAASKGLGRASAEALARDGVRVAICSRGGPALQAAADAIKAEGGEATAG